MTTINIVNKAPPTLTDLTASATDGGILYEWNTDNSITNLWGVELWLSDDNDRSNAVLVTTETGGSYLYTASPNVTKYAWIKAKDTFDNNNGAWEPVSSSAGVSGTSNELEIPSTGVPVTDSITTSAVNNNPAMSAFDTWYDGGYLEFTAPTQGLVTAHIHSFSGSSSVSLTDDGDWIKVWARLRLYNQTDAVDVEGVLKEFLVSYYLKLSGVVTHVVPDQMINENILINSDKLGTTKTGKSYRLYLEYMKEQKDTGGSITLATWIMDKSITAGATYS